MDSHKMYLPTVEEQERLRLKRKEWRIQQEYDKKHEERKLKMIKEYERKRAEDIKKQKSVYERQSKSSSLRRREDSSPDYGHFKEQKASVIVNDPQNIIDEKVLHKIKITIYNDKNLPTKNQSTSDKIERNVNLNDVILPRRPNEGACPIFQKNELEETKEIRTITISQNEQLVSEKQLSTSKTNDHTHKRPDDDIIQRYCSYKSNIYRHGRTDDDDDRYNRNSFRNRSSSRDNKEKNKSRSERRSRSTSRHSSRTTSLIKNRLRSCYRSRSHSPVNEQIKQSRIANDKNKFLSRRSPQGQTCKLNNSVSSKMNYSFSHNFNNLCMSLSRPMLMPKIQIPPMLMPRIQTQPILMPVFAPLFPGHLLNIHQWQRPPANRAHRWQRNWNQH